jgi:hypothetical protein
MKTEEQKKKHAEYMREYYHKNKEKCKANNKKSRDNLAHTWKSCSKEERRKMSQRQNEKRKTDYKYKIKQREKKKKDNLKAKEEMTELVKTTDWKAWYAVPENKEKYLEQRRRTYNPEKDKDRKLDERVRLRKEVFSMYGGCCVCCGEDNIGFLNIDHKNNDGAKRRKEGEWKGVALYRQIKRNGFPEDMQILCFNCNIAKHTYGKCPHQLTAEHAIYGNLQKVSTDGAAI